MNSSYSWSFEDPYSGTFRSSCSLRAITCHQRRDSSSLPPQLEILIHFQRIFRIFSRNGNGNGVTMHQCQLPLSRTSYESSLDRFVSSSEPSRLALVRQLLTEMPLIRDWLRNMDTAQFESMITDLAHKISSSAYDEAREASTISFAPGHRLVLTAEIDSGCDLIPTNPQSVPEPPFLNEYDEAQVLSLIGEREWRSDNSGDDDGTSVCTVCLDDFVPGERVAALRCFHHFHRDCIVRWLLLPTSRKSCPVCRMSVN